MFENYCKTAIRNLVRNKIYSLINIVGLAVGLACCFVIVVYIRHELSYDQFHEKSNRIYRLLQADSRNPLSRGALTAAGFAPQLENEFPEIESTVRLFTNVGPVDLKIGREARTVTGFAFADPSVFEVFSFGLSRGNPATALSHTNRLLLTPGAAVSLFGRDDPIGKIVTYLRGSLRINLQVTGILEEIPSNSHLQFDYLASFSTITEFMGSNALEDFDWHNYYTYLLLSGEAKPADIASNFNEFLHKNLKKSEAESTRLFLQPLKKIHLTTDIRWDVGTNTNRSYIYIFSVVALFVLLIATINFVNISTARSVERAREVGVRKVVGAHRRQLVLQLFGESTLAALSAMILAFGLMQIFMPLVNNLVGREINLDPFGNMDLLIILVGLGLIAGLLAGVYPAIVLSAFHPTRILKGALSANPKGITLRKGLIITQFSISTFLLIALVTVYSQLNYMRSKDLGFDIERVLTVNLSGPVKENFDAFRSQLTQHANIRAVGLGTIPGRVGATRTYEWPGMEHEAGQTFYTMFVDPHSLEALNIEIVAGRNFSDAIATDITNAYILNETAVKELGWKDAVGHPFRVWDEEMGTIIGVVKDFHFRSLHQEIEPLVLDVKPDWSWNAIIRIDKGDIRSTLDFVEKQWNALEPELPMNYKFLDMDFDRLYRKEEKLGRLFAGFTFLAVFVACLGLFGLAAFTATQRTKEIGIRKVLGASVHDILILLSSEFIRLVALSFVLAGPIAFLVMHSWLQNFAYRMTLGVLPFIYCGTLIVLVAFLTVCSQALRAALVNPAISIRYE